MAITAKIIKDSITAPDKEGDQSRITTMQLRYPKFIHAEFMTHRVFSRNASSSRAIPIDRMIEDIRTDPAKPVWWGKAQSGMQAREELEAYPRQQAEAIWLDARDKAMYLAKTMDNIKVHKQVVNRILEPFMHINVVVTSTEWANFFALRCHPDAQPEMQHLAVTMRIALLESQPQVLQQDEWHLPYVASTDKRDIPLSVARCARVSYLTNDRKEPTIAEDEALYRRLIGSEPLHASPAEHQATPNTWRSDIGWMHVDHGNFDIAWRQFRKMLPDEYIRG